MSQFTGSDRNFDQPKNTLESRQKVTNFFGSSIRHKLNFGFGFGFIFGFGFGFGFVSLIYYSWALIEVLATVVAV